jgi:hypothetical protein
MSGWNCSCFLYTMVVTSIIVLLVWPLNFQLSSTIANLINILLLIKSWDVTILILTVYMLYVLFNKIENFS